MNLSIKRCLSLCIYLFTVIDTGYGVEIIYNEDRPYEVMDIAVPKAIWKQALNPTPVLKSPATVTIPINVSDEDDSDEYSEEEDEVDDEVTTLATIINTTAAQEIATVSNDPIKNITDVPVQDEEQVSEVSPTEVSGQVIRFPCSCPDGQCGCCTGAILERINMKACGNISFIPEDFVFDVRLSINNQTVVRRKVSASDPPPICFNPRRAPFVRVCAEISNIRIRNQNAFACLDINADIGGFPVYSASFRCFGLGTKGVQTGLKPKPTTSGGPKPVNLFGSSSNDEPGFIENAVDTVLTGGIGEAVLGGGGGSGIFGGGGGPGIFGGGGGPGIFGGGGAGGLFQRKKG